MKKLSRIIMSFMVFLSPLIIALPTARAATDTCTWTGAVNGNWSNGGNWTGCDNGGVPENGDTLLFPNSASNKTSTNDIVGLSVASVIFTGQNYIINGSSLVITGLTAVQFTNTSGNNDLGIVSNVTSSSGVISQDNGASSNTISGNIVFTVTNDMNFYNYDSDNLILTGDRSGSSSNVNYYGNISLSGTGTNTYTGAINVSNTIGASKLFVNSTTTLGAGNPSVNVTGEAGVSFEAAGTYTNNVSISASGTEATNIQSNGNVTLSGTINAFAPSGYIKPQSGNL